MAGTLFVVATPIGNLEDITLRALRILGEVDLIACEDTRHTKKLLSHFQIDKPTCSYHEHNEHRRTNWLLQRLESGVDIALVSDAGTPSISDPGYRLVRTSIERGIRVSPIPGACSIIAALSVSGRPTDSFVFLGFLPSKPKARRSILEEIRREPRTVLLFESPFRLTATLRELQEIFGARQMTVVREMTKIHEELVAGTVPEVLCFFRSHPPKGEAVLILEKAFSKTTVPESLGDKALRIRLEGFMDQGLSKKDALKRLARELGCPKRELYLRLARETAAVSQEK